MTITLSVTSLLMHISKGLWHLPAGERHPIEVVGVNWSLSIKVGLYFCHMPLISCIVCWNGMAITAVCVLDVLCEYKEMWHFFSFSLCIATGEIGKLCHCVALCIWCNWQAPRPECKWSMYILVLGLQLVPCTYLMLIWGYMSMGDDYTTVIHTHSTE